VAARNAALNVAGGVKVDVFIRVRPHVAEDGESADVVSVEGSEVALRERDGRSADVFRFDKVFPAACGNEELFGTAMRGIADQVARGLSSCVFAYGQTGSGKTYTMRGTLVEPDDPAQHGLIQRSVAYLLEATRRVYSDVRTRVSMLEVYNEQLEDLFIPVVDAGSAAAAAGAAAVAAAGGGGGGAIRTPAGAPLLRSASAGAAAAAAAATGTSPLDSNVVPFETARDVIVAMAKATAVAPAPGSAAALAALAAGAGGGGGGGGMKPLTLVDHPERGTVCVGLSEVEVTSVEQVTWLLRRAEERSRFTATAMNKASNRAHRVFTLIIQFKRGDAWFTTTLTLVDLAGSEDISRSGATGVAAKEASHINKSLLTLGRVINALASNSPHIPYRESKLTRLLSEALGGVCKTTFIACVSPAATSATETASTLRYAKRASEALNISQLPRWQQDEILIEGLTRRVQMLEGELSGRDAVHAREIASVQTKLDAARVENAGLLDYLARARAHLAHMAEQQLAARSALAAVTVHRDRLEAQKAALRAELVETRRVRDGYLADRGQVAAVVAAARATRDALLAAYATVEGRLTADAGALKATVERALVELEATHAEVARKRDLSRFNERAADEVCDAMTARLRGALEATFAFRDGQATAHAAATEALSNMALEREHAAADTASEVHKLVRATLDVLAGVADTVAGGDVAARARSLRSREDVRTNAAASAAAFGQLREAVEAGVGAARGQCVALEEALRAWAAKATTRNDALLAATNEFAARMAADLTALQTDAADAAAAASAKLAEHERAIEAMRVGEAAAAAAASQRMVTDIAAQVARIVADATADGARRLDRGCATLRDESAAIAAAVRDASRQTCSAATAAAGGGAAHREATAAALAGAGKASAAAAEATTGSVAALAAHMKGVDGDVAERAGKAAARATAAATEFAERSVEGDAAAARVTASVRDTTAAGAAAAQSATGALVASVSAAAEAFGAAVTEAQGAENERAAALNAYVDDAADSNKAQEAEMSEYTHTTLRRDTQPDPRPAKYTYPTTFAAMAAYDAVVAGTGQAGLVAGWTREESVRSGRALPGVGVDYAGERGRGARPGVVTRRGGGERVDAGVARLRDRTPGAPRPDLAALDSACLTAAANALVTDVEAAAAGLDADMEGWFASMAALLAEHGITTPAGATGSGATGAAGTTLMFTTNPHGGATPAAGGAARVVHRTTSRRVPSPRSMFAQHGDSFALADVALDAAVAAPAAAAVPPPTPSPPPTATATAAVSPSTPAASPPPPAVEEAAT